MSTLHVLARPLAGTGDDAALRRWLAQGERQPPRSHPRIAMLRRLFRFAGDELPAGALRHRCYADGADTGVWLCADPAFVRVEATGARLLGWPLADLASADAVALAATLRPLLGDAGMPLEIDTPSAWCARLAEGAPLARLADPAAALGASLLDCLPAGDAGRAWRKLFNDVQVALHDHPVNAARVAAGRRPVNALWFWGAGALPEPVDSGLLAVASVDDVLRGLARTARVMCIEPAPAALDALGAPGGVLLDLDGHGCADAPGDWLPHFRRWLRVRRFSAIELAFADGPAYRVTHAHRLRFWRRA